MERLGIFTALRGLSGGASDDETTEEERIRRSPFLSEGYVEEQLRLVGIEDAMREVNDLGDLPLIVIVAGPRANAQQLWFDMQSDTASLSTNSALWIAEMSDHMIPENQPDIIVDAIREMVEAHRSGRPIEAAQQ